MSQECGVQAVALPVGSKPLSKRTQYITAAVGCEIACSQVAYHARTREQGRNGGHMKYFLNNREAGREGGQKW
eukprot:6200702-Pleurochrysis_carterae.AAC.2